MKASLFSFSTIIVSGLFCPGPGPDIYDVIPGKI